MTKTFRVRSAPDDEAVIDMGYLSLTGWSQLIELSGPVLFRYLTKYQKAEVARICSLSSSSKVRAATATWIRKTWQAARAEQTRRKKCRKEGRKE